jgi:hypothetical protein
MWNGRRKGKILFVSPIPLSYAQKKAQTHNTYYGRLCSRDNVRTQSQQTTKTNGRGFLFISHRILALRFQWIAFLARFQQVTFVDKMRTAYKISVEKTHEVENSLLGDAGVDGKVINSILLGLCMSSAFSLLKLASVITGYTQAGVSWLAEQLLPSQAHSPWNETYQ